MIPLASDPASHRRVQPRVEDRGADGRGDQPGARLRAEPRLLRRSHARTHLPVLRCE